MRARFGRIGIFAHQGPGAAGCGRRDQDGAPAAGVAQPAPQEAAAVAAAAMQRHHQRPGAIGRVVFRHIEREAAAAAGLVVVVDDAGVFRGRGGEPRREIGILAQRRIEKEVAHRRQFRGQRIQRLLRAGAVAQCAKHRHQVPIAVLDRAQALERRQRRIACRLERCLQVAEFSGPAGQPRPHRAQRLVGQAGGFHDRAKIRRVEVAGDEAERFQRLQQRRQHGHDVVHHGLAHRVLHDWQSRRLQCSRGALSSFARSVEANTTSKVTPS